MKKEIADFTEHSSAVVDAARLDFILVKLAGKGVFLITQLSNDVYVAVSEKRNCKCY